MNGAEQVAVWLFGIFCAAASVATVAKAWSTARVEVAKANAGAYVNAHRIVSEAQFGPTTLPAWMTKDGES